MKMTFKNVEYTCTVTDLKYDLRSGHLVLVDQ